MTREIRDGMIILSADDSKILTDGKLITKTVYLGSNSAEANWYEVDSYLDEPIERETETDKRITELEKENALVKAQIEAQSEQMDFYEECIAEMAEVIYA